MSQDKKVNELAERIMEWYFRVNPFIATMLGRHEYDAKVPDFSKDALKTQLQKVQKFLEELERMGTEGLSSDGRVDYQLLENLLKKNRRSLEVLKTYEKNPGMVPGMIMSTTYLMLTREYAPLISRMKNIMKRLKHVPRLLEQQRALIKDPPAVFIEIALMQTRGGLKFLSGIKENVRARTGILSPLLSKNIDRAIEAFQEHLKWLEEILPEATGDFAVGEKIFEQMLQEDHFLPYTAAALLEKGQELFAYTRRQMEELSKKIDPSKETWEILEDIKNQHPEAHDLIPYYRRELEKVKKFVQEKDIVDIPEGETLIIEETPFFQRSTIPYAAYMPPAPFEEKQEGRFFVTPVDHDSSEEEQREKLQGHSIYKIPVTTLHEGYPGHHLQLVWSNKAPSLIRKLSMSTLFAEGWAFYCEELMEQLGYIDNDKMKLARLKDQLWRAARIIIDVSLHTGKMSIDEAINFLVEEVQMEKSNAKAEVYRYTTSPTQPMSYLIGKLEILKIVEEYKEKKGNDLQLKEIHNHLLSFGTIPPALVREAIFPQ